MGRYRAPAAAPLRRRSASLLGADRLAVMLVYLDDRQAHRACDRAAAAADARRPARRRRHAVLHARSDQRDDHEPPRASVLRTRAARRARRGSALVAERLRVLYFGTYERDYPRNAQVISCLRTAGVEVVERHASVWEGREHKFAAGPRGAAARRAPSCVCSGARRERLRRARRRLPGPLRPARGEARRARTARRLQPARLARATRSSRTARASAPGSRRAHACSARSTAQRFAPPTSSSRTPRRTRALLPRARRRGASTVCFVGAEERVFRPGWQPPAPSPRSSSAS